MNSIPKPIVYPASFDMRATLAINETLDDGPTATVTLHDGGECSLANLLAAKLGPTFAGEVRIAITLEG